jgi:hypothetical protein
VVVQELASPDFFPFTNIVVVLGTANNVMANSMVISASIGLLLLNAVFAARGGGTKRRLGNELLGLVVL